MTFTQTGITAKNASFKYIETSLESEHYLSQYYRSLPRTAVQCSEAAILLLAQRQEYAWLRFPS